MLRVLLKPNICLFIKDGKLMKAYNNVCNKISNIMQKGFGSKPEDNGKYLK